MMKGYINDTLIHWTGRGKDDSITIGILKNIVSEKRLYLSYCPNYADSDIKDHKTMMICFTDLPLRNCDEFCSLFGKFGIGFKKETFIKYGANPVFYTTNQHLERMTEISGLIQRLLNEEVDREWRSTDDRYQFTKEQLYSLLEVYGFTQEYSYKDRHINYYQREWRLNYDTLPIEVGKRAEKPGYGGLHGLVNGKMMCEMMFAIEDVDYIVVPKEHKKVGTQLAKEIGCSLKIYEIEVERKWWKRFF